MNKTLHYVWFNLRYYARIAGFYVINRIATSTVIVYFPVADVTCSVG